MRAFDPNGNEVLNVMGSGSVGQQGITELFFESAEPSWISTPSYRGLEGDSLTWKSRVLTNGWGSIIVKIR